MRLNEKIKIFGKNIILVPYEAKHVEKYHQWMLNPELQELTASEPLTIEQEYAMQSSWRNDEDKCTFLILCRKTYDDHKDEIEALVGDINLFLQFEEDSNGCQQKIAEVEIMIAEPSVRGKGYGKEATLLMLKYARSHLAIDKFVSKIGMDNEKSLNMFQRLRFVEVSRVEIFREITLECLVTEQYIAWLDEQVGTLQIEPYRVGDE